jgi:hypothetical protein
MVNDLSNHPEAEWHVAAIRLAHVVALAAMAKQAAQSST